MGEHEVVSHEEWVAARQRLLEREKAFNRDRDELSRERRELPWERVDKPYVFEGPSGTLSFAELFGDHSQLVVYHFMFDPSWDAGCPHCSFWGDNFDGAPVHLAARDVAFAAVSRAPFEKLSAYKARMGWSFPWVSSFGSDFNYDFGVSFPAEATSERSYNFGTMEPGMEDREGLSVFCKAEDGGIFRTYSTYARGIDMINGTYHILDLVPKGRDERKGDPQFWVRRHDEYLAAT
ncbi:MAG TPA: DUF899 domain-containing protein [Acidimicrobiales bacterium]|nr:DUF899 domain-containing protein [Acidimicrobiales bacterium]